MTIESGSRIHITGSEDDSLERAGTIGEVLDNGFVVVEWDDGTDSMLSPGSVQLEGDGADRSRATLGCQIDLRVSETVDDCHAVAWMDFPRGTFTAIGAAHRSPADPNVPLIGEELAIARSLHRLADQLEAAAKNAMADPQHTERHLL